MARNFNNANDLIQVANATAINIAGTALTLACWFRPTTINGTSRPIVGKWSDAPNAYSQYALRIESGNHLQFAAGGAIFNDAIGATVLTANTWYHGCGVKNGTTGNSVLTYLNGAQDGATNGTATMATQTTPLRFGVQGDTAIEGNYLGDLAEVAIWDVALSVEEIAALAKGTPPNAFRPDHLKGYWPLYGLSGTEADLSGNANHGTVARSLGGKTFYLLNSLAGTSQHMASQDGGTAPATATTGTGWTVAKTAASNYARLDSQTKRVATTFAATAQPNGAPDNTLGDCIRTPNALTGVLHSANWDIQLGVIAVSAGGSQDGRLRYRVWRSVNQDGSSATEITAATQLSATVTNLTTTQVNLALSATWNPGAVTLNGEYLFFQVAWEITGAASSTSADVVLRVDSNSRFITPLFLDTTSGPTASDHPAMAPHPMLVVRSAPESFIVSGAVITKTSTISVAHSAVLSRGVVNGRAPAISVAISPALSRQFLGTRALAASDAHSAALARVGVHPRNPAATDAHSATLARQALNTHTLTITDGNTAALVRSVTNTRTSVVSDGHSATLTRAFVYARAPTVSVANSAVLARALNLIRTATISVAVTPALSRIYIATRAPAISRAITATLSRAQVLTRASAWSAAMTATLSRVYVAVRTATISRTHTAALSRAVTNARTSTISVAQTATLSRAQLLSRLSAISVASTAALSRLQNLVRTTTISRAHTATLSRTVVPGGGNVLTRTLTASISHAAALSRAVVNARNPVWSATNTAMLSRVANVVRTTATTVANTAALNRATILARLGTSTIAHTASLSKTVIWTRVAAWTAGHAATLARQTTAIREASVAVAHSATVSRTALLVRTAATNIAHTATLVGFRFEALPPGAIGRLIGRATSIGRLVMRVSPVGKLVQSTRLRGRRR